MVEVFQEVKITQDIIDKIKRLAVKKVRLVELENFPSKNVGDKPQAISVAKAHIVRAEEEVKKLGISEEVFTDLLNTFIAVIVCNKIKECYLVACEYCALCYECPQSNKRQKESTDPAWVYHCLKFNPVAKAELFTKFGQDKNKLFLANILKSRF